MQGRLEVVLGVGAVSVPPTPARVFGRQVVMHERYRPRIDAAFRASDAGQMRMPSRRFAPDGDDLALLKLGRPLARTRFTQISLSATTDPSPTGNAQVRVAGFGYTEAQQLNRLAGPMVGVSLCWIGRFRFWKRPSGP